MSKDSFSHLNQKGQAHMVDVSPKPMTQREAVASGRVIIGPDAFNLLIDSKISKGDILAVARIAGIMAAKKVETLIPLCHSLTLQKIEIDFTPDSEKNAIEILARAKAKGATGVEMEALTAVSVAALTIYDMCKSAEKNITIIKPAERAEPGKESSEENTSMERVQLEYFRSLLQKKLDDLLGEADKTLEEMTDMNDHFPDPTDRASVESDRSFELRIRDRERKLIKKINKALERIEEGTYGICEDCGEEIGTKRLTARPVTTRCIKCKSKQEKEEKARGL